MKRHMRILGVVMAAALAGSVANFAVADPGSEWTGGPGYGMGPGMMGGYGMGQGMMGGYGMGQGMMGGYGMDSGMMGGYGMGRGMMGDHDFRGMNLSADQKARITQIRKEMRAKHWPLMGEMMDARDKLQDLYDADKQDSAAINEQYKVIDGLRRQMVESAVDAHNRINEILSKEQREKYREWRRGYGPMRR